MKPRKDRFVIPFYNPREAESGIDRIAASFYIRFSLDIAEEIATQIIAQGAFGKKTAAAIDSSRNKRPRKIGHAVMHHGRHGESPLSCRKPRTPNKTHARNPPVPTLSRIFQTFSNVVWTKLKLN